MTLGIFIGFLVGLFLPAPYSTVVRNTVRNGWNWLASFGSRGA